MLIGMSLRSECNARRVQQLGLAFLATLLFALLGELLCSGHVGILGDRSEIRDVLGNVVVYTSDSVVATRWVMFTGDSTYANELSWIGGVSADGRVVHATLATDDSHDALWFTQTGDVVTPPYPGDWDAGYINSINADGSVFVGFGMVWLDQSTVERYPYISRDGTLESIDVPDGLGDVIPQELSADGERFVGDARDLQSDSVEGIFWDDAGGVRPLYDELVARGLELPIDAAIPGSHLVSSDGRVIILAASNLAPFTRIVLSD